jgi:tetrapyrrole methylase family protein/MazG family protein
MDVAETDLSQDTGSGTDRLLAVVAQLRGENGCPWDREQTLDSLKPYLVEESYELLDAIENGDVPHHREELGDVLLQVVLQSQIRTEEGHFTFDEVAHEIAEKLIRRHPHVFADAVAEDADAVIKRWEEIKSGERKEKGKGNESIIDGVPRFLPALQRAQRTQERGARVGFDWGSAGPVFEKVEEELQELREALDAGDAVHQAEELGDLLFSVVNLARFLDTPMTAEEALRHAVDKFAGRFKQVEAVIAQSNRQMADCTLEELDAAWDNIKQIERTKQK